MSEPESAWEAHCPDCDHGIRGGKPCGTCGGRGHVIVTFYREAQSTPMVSRFIEFLLRTGLRIEGSPANTKP